MPLCLKFGTRSSSTSNILYFALTGTVVLKSTTNERVKKKPLNSELMQNANEKRLPFVADETAIAKVG